MSGATLAWAIAGMVVAALAGGQLIRASMRPQAHLRNGYRWLAAAAVCLGAGGAVQQAFRGLIGGAPPLRVADLISLAGLAALAIGLATLTSDLAGGQADRPARRLVGPVPGILIDSLLLVASVFVMCMVTAFGPDYTGSGVGAGLFALDLIRPCADLIVIGLGLRFAVRDPRQALLPVLAVGVLLVGDCVAVAARAGGQAPGGVSQAALVAALGLLVLSSPLASGRLQGAVFRLAAPGPSEYLAPSAAPGERPPGTPAGSVVPGERPPGTPAGSAAVRPLARGDGWSSPATLAALAATAAAALVVTGYALSGASVASPALAVSGAMVILLLVVKLAELAFHASATAAAAQDSDSKFRALADTTIDVVMVCDLNGVIEYVSPAIAEYGYQPDQLTGTRLLDLMHPQDRLAGVSAALAGQRAAQTGVGAARTGAATFAGRVRGADGSWRHVEATVSRYGADDEPGRLLVTARDVSDRVELRRQVAHLTFHDGLTGLPNRAYIERRLAEMRAASAGHGGRVGRGGRESREGRESRAGRAGRLARHGRDPGTGQSASTVQSASTAQPGSTGPVGVILLDVDGAAAVNDLVGRSGGDLLLAQAGRRLRAAAPPEATVARWGGDKFAVLVSDAGSESELVELAERLAAEIAVEPFDVAGEQIAITVSVGVAVGALGGATGDGEGAVLAQGGTLLAGGHPRAPDGLAGGHPRAPDGLETPGIDDVLGGAQAAMCRAKEAGGGRVAAFAAEMHAAARRRAELAVALREAIAGEGLELRYQPIVELATSTVAGVEALVRWNWAGQQVSPGEFLAVADECGLTAELGGWVLREASRQVAAWRAAGWDLGLSVNVSARQATSPRFAGWLIEQLDDAGLPPRALTIEVTEGLLVDVPGPVAGELAGLRGRGVRLAIDDFGTANFSLTHLRELAVDVIKVDPSFVAGLGTDPTVSLLTKAIVQLGSDLGIEVIAEGIERPEQLDHLLAMGCELGQGFALAVPMTAAETEQMLAGQRRGKVARRRVHDQAHDQACSQAS